MKVEKYQDYNFLHIGYILNVFAHSDGCKFHIWSPFIFINDYKYIYVQVNFYISNLSGLKKNFEISEGSRNCMKFEFFPIVTPKHVVLFHIENKLT